VIAETTTIKEEDIGKEVPMEEVVITMMKNHNKNIKENVNTDPPPLVPPKMIPQVTSRVVGVHLSVITIAYYVMSDWGPLDG
jgi:hypothetical protein